MTPAPHDPTDAPAPLTATLRRQGLIGANDGITLVTTPPPVQDRPAPGTEVVSIGGRKVTVRTTPPPPLRRQAANRPMDEAREQEMRDAIASLTRATPPPAPSVRHDVARGPAAAAIVAGVILLLGFAALLIAG